MSNRVSKILSEVLSMSLEFWKSFFEIGGVVLLFLTFVFAGGLVITVNRLNAIQEKELQEFRLKIEAEEQKTASAQKEAADSQLALMRASAFATKPRRIIMDTRNGDGEKRAAKIKEVAKYADTPTLVVFVRDDEAEILAYDIGNVLKEKAGWKSVEVVSRESMPIPLGYIKSGVQIHTFVKVNKTPIPALPLPGLNPPPIWTALFELLNLDLGQEAAGTPFGVQWNEDGIVNGVPMGLLKWGLKVPENGIVITVGNRPADQIFEFLPEPPKPQVQP
jgi:hypothetical protein